MNKIFRYSIFSLLAVVVTMLSACSSDDDTETTDLGEQVYFSYTLPTTIETPATASSFDVTVKRIKTEGTLAVPVTATMADGSIYSLASNTVEFKDGEAEATVTFNYDPAKIIYGKYYDITLKLDDQFTNEYGLASYSFKAGATEWQDMSDKATYRDDIVGSLFSIGNPVYSVDIQKSVVTDGVYRIKNAYTTAYETYAGELGATIDKDNDYWITIDASDPDAVYITGGETGLNMGETYGKISITSMVSYYMAKGSTLDQVKNEHPEQFGTLVDGIITLPAKSILVSMSGPDYAGNYYYGNSTGLFTVALPGSKIADYSLEFKNTGSSSDIDGEEFALGTFTFGEDITSVKYALAKSWSEVDAVATGIVDGSVESTTQEEAGDVKIPISESGTYYLVVVGYDNTEAVTNQTFVIRFSSSHPNKDHWKALYTGVYSYSVEALEEGAAGIYEGSDSTVVMYQSTNDPNKYRLAPWCGSKNGLIFTKDETTGEFIVNNVDTWETMDGYGVVYASCYKVATGENEYPCKYATEKNDSINFYLEYQVEAGSFGLVLETFKITGEVSANEAKIRKGKAYNLTSESLLKNSYRRDLLFRGKRIDMGSL